MHRVDAAYRALARREPGRIVALDGERPAASIAEEIREHVRALL
jgi:thymidylate kinase